MNNVQLYCKLKRSHRPSSVPGSSSEAAVPNPGLDARPFSDVRDDGRESDRGWEAEIMMGGEDCSSFYERWSTMVPDNMSLVAGWGWRTKNDNDKITNMRRW